MGGALRENGARGGERSKLRWNKITKDKRPNEKRNPKKQKTKKISSTKRQTQMRCGVSPVGTTYYH